MKNLCRLMLPLLMLALLPACRSQKSAVAPAQEEAPTWSNVTMPVRVTIAKPMNLSMNGTATMVRGEYVLVSFRTFGLEIASVCLTPENMDLVMKMPQKLWVSEPMGERLNSRKLKFTSLQEAMLGNDAVLKSLPEGLGLTTGGTASAPEITLRTQAKGQNVEVTLAWDLEQAKWNVASPARFSTPGDSYRRITLDSAVKSLAP